MPEQHERPAFALEMQDAPRTGERLHDLKDLVGETILGAFDATTDGEFVLVTENKNWIVIDAEDSFGRDEAPTLVVKPPRYYGTKDDVLSDYVSPRDLLAAGVINSAVYQELQAQADKAAAEERERKAASLRAALARLEGEQK